MEQYPSWCAEAWVAFQILRNMGFTADDIYFGCADVIGVGHAATMNLVQPGREFVWTLARLGDEKADDVEATWTKFATDMNASTEAERQAVWDSAKDIWVDFTYIRLWTVLRNKGFLVPSFADVEEKLDASGLSLHGR